MRQELLESYRKSEINSRALSVTSRLLEDVSLERDSDLKGWSLLAQGTNDLTVGMGAVFKDLEPQLAAIVRKNAYLLYYQSPYVRGVIRTLRKFVFGKGLTVELDFGKDLNKSDKLKEQGEQYLKDWSEENKWGLGQKEMSDRSFRDGECFLYNRSMGNKEKDPKTGKAKLPKLEFLEPDAVQSDDPDITYGIELDEADPTKVKYYHVKKAADKQAEKIPGEDVIHVKLNVDSNVKRGRSILEPVLRHLKLHDDWLNTRIVLNRVRNAVAIVRTVDGRQVQGEVIRKANRDTSRANRTNAQKTFKAGSIITAGPGVKYEMLAPNLGASDASEDGRNILLAIAVGVGFPEMFLTGDYSNANFASTAVAQNPFVREFEDWQDFFDVYIKAQYKRVLELGIALGLISKDTPTTVVTKWPPLTYEDFVAMSTALGQLFQNEIISKHTYAAKLNFDYEEEKEKIEEEQIDSAANDLITGEFGPGEEEEEETQEESETQPKASKLAEAEEADIVEAEPEVDEAILEEVRRRLRRIIEEDYPDWPEEKIKEQIELRTQDYIEAVLSEHYPGGKGHDQKKHAGDNLSLPFSRKHLTRQEIVKLDGPIKDADDKVYFYHATTLDNAYDIATHGLSPHGPSFGTDQRAWPDGSKVNRSYFGRSDNVYYFAKPDSSPVALRVKKNATRFHKEKGTGDIYARNTIRPKYIDILTSRGWRPVITLSTGIEEATVRSHARRTKKGKITTVRQHERVIHRNPKKWAKDIEKDKDTVEHLWQFTDSSDDVNSMLRGTDYSDYSDDRAYFKEQIKSIDRAIDKFELPKDVTVFRGGSFERKPSWLKKGSVMRDKGFISTSLKRSVAKEFADDLDEGVSFVLDIKVPKGTKAAPVFALRKNNFKYQKEIVLPRGSKFKITKTSEKVYREYGEIVGRRIEAEAVYVK